MTTTDLDSDLAAMTVELDTARAELARLRAGREPIGGNPVWRTSVEVVLVGDFGEFDLHGRPGFDGWVEVVDGTARSVRVRDRAGARRSVPFDACRALAMRGHLPAQISSDNSDD